MTRSTAVVRATMLLVSFACSAPDENVAPLEPAAAEPGDASIEDEATAPDQPLRTATVEVYFPSAVDDGLVGEFREIFDTATPGDRVKQIIADLISGPTTAQCMRAVPPGTRLRQAYVLADGTAYLDFSSELTEGIGGGSMKELLTVYSIVDSVAFNLREVQRVAILVNGRPIETMNGHLDLRRPLNPDARMILGSIVVGGRLPGAPARAAAAD